MKQHITPKQAEQLQEKVLYSLFDNIVPRKDWAHYHHKKITIGKMVEIIRNSYDLKIVSVEKGWDIQLFSKTMIVHEEIGEDLVDTLFKSILWALSQNK